MIQKNISQLFFHEESIHEVSRRYLIPEYHSCKIAGSKILKKANNSKNVICFFFQFFIKYFIHHPLSADKSFKFLAIKLFETRHLQNFIPLFVKSHNFTWGDNSGKTKYTCRLFFHEESIHEVSRRYFEPPYIHTYGQAETNMSPTFSKFGA